MPHEPRMKLFTTSAGFQAGQVESIQSRVRASLLRTWGLPCLVLGVLAWFGSVRLTEVGDIAPPAVPSLLLADPVPDGDDWPGWRGPTQQGSITTASSPLQWQLPVAEVACDQRWRTSPPCISGQLAVLLREERSNGKSTLVAFDRRVGTLRWQIDVGSEPMTPVAKTLLPTPASDGRRLFVPLIRAGQLWLAAFDHAGQRLWETELGPCRRALGPAQSPIIAGSLVLVALDQAAPAWQLTGAAGFIAAVHRQAGQLIWRNGRPSGTSEGTPVVVTLDEHQQVVIPGRGGVRSYDLHSGKFLWWARWPARSATGSVVADEHSIYAVSDGPEREILCIRGNGRGDVSESHVIWRARSAGGSAGPILIADELIVLDENGALTALDRQTGRALWQQRLPGHYSSAPIWQGRALSCFSDSGGMVAVDPFLRGQILVENPQAGTPAVACADDRWYFATTRGLVFIGAHETPHIVLDPTATAVR